MWSQPLWIQLVWIVILRYLKGAMQCNVFELCTKRDKIIDACQRRFFIHRQFLSMLYGDHNRCTYNDLKYAAINSVDLLVPYKRVARMCPISLPVRDLFYKKKDFIFATNVSSWNIVNIATLTKRWFLCRKKRSFIQEYDGSSGFSETLFCNNNVNIPNTVDARFCIKLPKQHYAPKVR